METAGGFLVTGSKNQILVINADDLTKARCSEDNQGQICKICSDNIRFFEDKNEYFVACNECEFPVCETCYKYERREGTQSCPQCKTRYKRQKGFPRVPGDEEEEGFDDIYKEFDFGEINNLRVFENKLQSQSSLGQNSINADFFENIIVPYNNTKVPLLTNGEEVNGISHDNHALIIHPNEGQILPPFSLQSQPRPINPNKDISLYGYGTIAWNERLNNWRKKQLDLIQRTQSSTYNDNPGFDNPDLENPDLSDESRAPLSRKVPIASSKINPYRIVILLRLVILGLFFHYRILNPVTDAYGLWLTSVICEVWFAVSWILDQFPKWCPIERETYLDRLSLRYEREGKPSLLSPIDIFITTVDPTKEPPLITANTVLSILAVDYPPDKISCYVSDDGAAMLTFEALCETSEFAKKWVPFCKKYSVEPRAPEWYFGMKIDYLKDKVHPNFVRERRAMKREYEEFKVRINGLVEMAKKVPEEGWSMQDGTPWPGNNIRDHPAMIQVFLGQDNTEDDAGNPLPKLIYVSREKRPGHNHHKKAGAMNALVRVSAVISNAPFILNVDCDHYINNSKALREAMCFMMDPISGKKICYVQFPQRFDGIDKHDRYSNRNVVFFDINMKGLDGIQGPIYVGTGCVFRRHALYGFDAPVKSKPPSRTCNCWPKWCCFCFKSRTKCKKTNKKTNKNKQNKDNSINSKGKYRDSSSQIHALEDITEVPGVGMENGPLVPREKLEKKFGQSPLFVASTLKEDGIINNNNNNNINNNDNNKVDLAESLKEAVHVISCGYEDKTEWGKEVGWIYGSVTEDILTGFKMHCHGWRSVYCMPKRPAFKGSAPINLSDRLHQVLRWALGSVEIFLSKHCPIWYGYRSGLKWLERVSYINSVVYPWTSIPLVVYCTLPAVCLLTGKFIVPQIDTYASLIFMALFVSIAGTGILEMRWGHVAIDDWWRNEQFWVIGGVSSHLFALFQGLLKVLAGIDTNFTVTSKGGDDEDFSELYLFKWTSLLFVPMSLLILNFMGVIAGISTAMTNYDSWGHLFGRVFFAGWVILHLYPFLKGCIGKHDKIPSIVVVWSFLLASICSLLWVRLNPFIGKYDGPVLELCNGLDCD